MVVWTISERQKISCAIMFFFFASFREHYVIMHKTDFYVDA